MDLIQAATGRAIATIDSAAPIRTADPFAEKTATNTNAIANISDQMNGRLANIESLLSRVLSGTAGGSFIGNASGFAARAGAAFA